MLCLQIVNCGLMVCVVSFSGAKSSVGRVTSWERERKGGRPAGRYRGRDDGKEEERQIEGATERVGG